MVSIKGGVAKLEIDQLIVHEVPRQDRGTPAAPRLSTRASTLTTQVKTFFEEKSAEVLLAKGFDVIFADKPASQVPSLMDDYFKGSLDFVSCSQRLAEELVKVQGGRVSEGLLTVAECVISGKRALGIIKLEKEEGVQVLEEMVDGGVTFNVEHVRSLMLSNKTRVFKVGLFVREGKTLKTTPGLVSDVQQSRTSVHGVALFFLEKFLGCTLKVQPEVTTRDFFHGTVGFVTTQVEDPSLRADYLMALRSELASNDSSINPKDFAKKHLRQEHRRPLMDALKVIGVEDGDFIKSTTLITGDLKKLKISLKSGIQISASPEAMKAHVEMEEQEDGQTKFSIIDEVTEVR